MFAEIRARGDNITSCLRHVPESEKMYKQKIEHGATDMSVLDKKKNAAEVGKAAGEQQKEDPVLALEGDKRWVVRHHAGTAGEQLRLSLDSVQMRHAVRIENCENVYIDITGKVNSVAIVNCKKVQVAMTSVVASAEMLRCTQCDMQVAESASTITIEHCDTVSLYLLSKEHARETEVITSSISSVNVLFPSEVEDEEMVERAVPEQFVSKVVADGNGGYKLQTEPNTLNL